MPVDHYENFPVASFLLPVRLREPVEAIYAFARGADDLADEGDDDQQTRLAALQAYRDALTKIEHGQIPRHALSQAMFERLARNIEQFSLPLQPFHDLLDAFSQDVVKTRYADFDELRAYTRRSADPVGRLLLHLYDAASEHNLRLSDAICSSLQLINFWQDVAVDWEKERVYVPQDELQRFGLDESHIAAGRCDDRWRALMRFQVGRARDMMLYGAPLALHLRGRIGWELRLIVAGGLRILQRIEAVDYDVFRARPELGKADGPAMLWRAFFSYPR